MKKFAKMKSERGFTLIELLVVIAIIDAGNGNTAIYSVAMAALFGAIGAILVWIGVVLCGNGKESVQEVVRHRLSRTQSGAAFDITAVAQE